MGSTPVSFMIGAPASDARNRIKARAASDSKAFDVTPAANGHYTSYAAQLCLGLRTMSTADVVMAAHHDHRLVALSVLISILAAYAAVDLMQRVRDARGRTWLIWLMCAAIVDGTGTWSMHYTGKLALLLPVALEFDWRMVLVSWLVGIMGSAAALFVLSVRKIGRTRAFAASILLGGVGISGLHYTSMAAMRVPDIHHYSPLFVILSIAIAITTSFMSLTLTPIIAHDRPGRSSRLHGAALLRGTANPVMHYTAMAGVTFAVSGAALDSSHVVSISSLGILGISIVPIMVLVVGLLTSFVNRLQKQSALLNELFEQAPHAVALLSTDTRIVRVNREFTRVFGYSPHESVGRPLTELIIPDERQDEEKSYAASNVPAQTLDLDSVRKRKDGSHLYVSITRVPVSLPGGQVEIYAMYRDITKRKLAEEALRRSEQDLRELLEERQRLSRDLHDHIVQAIYAIGMRLERLQRKGPADVAEDLKQMIDGLNQVIRDARQYIAGSQPNILTEPQFRAELAKLIDSANLMGGLRFEVNVDPAAFARLSPSEAEHVLHIAREALSNTLRHAHAQRALLVLELADVGVRLAISDNGTGFDAEDPRHTGSGLENMASRARQMGATLKILSGPQGTRIVLELAKREPLEGPASTSY
jgi:PAS domain S-box-containing protein